MKAALVGLTQSGKSTLLAAISGKQPAQSGSNQLKEVIVPVPDARIDWLTDLYKPEKTTRATIDCLDLPGFGLEDATARSAARRLLDQVRSADLFVLVSRSFKNDSVPAYRGGVDPRRDVLELTSEFLLADLELVSTRVEKLQVQVQKPTKTQAQDKEELALQLKLQEALENGKPVHTAVTTPREEELIRSLGLFTMKPLMVVVNVGEDELSSPIDVSDAIDRSVPVLTLCAKIEEELQGLDADSRTAFMADLGITESAVSKFVNSCYSAMGLISFLTVGTDEVRAWPIRRGSTALEAGGKIHSDIRRGFIRAETFSFSDLKELGDEKAIKSAGKFRLEGKTYVVQDGDIMNFRFNV